MIIRDAELQGVEIPLPQPALEVAGVTIRPHRGCSKPWLPSALPPVLGQASASEVAVSQLPDPGRLMKHSQREAAMRKTPRHNGGVCNCDSTRGFL